LIAKKQICAECAFIDHRKHQQVETIEDSIKIFKEEVDFKTIESQIDNVIMKIEKTKEEKKKEIVKIQEDIQDKDNLVLILNETKNKIKKVDIIKTKNFNLLRDCYVVMVEGAFLEKCQIITPEEQNQLRTWVSATETTPTSKPWKLIYKATKDGWDASNFRKNCSEKKLLLLLWFHQMVIFLVVLLQLVGIQVEIILLIKNVFYSLLKTLQVSIWLN